MVDILLASLLDAINAQRDYKTGNLDIQDVNESSNRFIMALNSLIDRRINANIDDRRKFKKDSLAPISILNSAPEPLDEIDLIDMDCVREWFAQYKDWYEKKVNCK